MVNDSTGSQSAPLTPLNTLGAMSGFGWRQSQRPRLSVVSRAEPPASPASPAMSTSSATSATSATEISRALFRAHQARAQVAVRIDSESAALAVLSSRQQSMRELRRRRNSAEAAGAAEHPIRVTEQQVAQAAELQARHALPTLRRRVEQQRQLLTAAQGATPGLRHALDLVLRDPQRTVQHEQAITSARHNLQTNTTAVATHREHLQAAQAALQAGMDQHVAAQLRLTAANAAVARLATARQALTTAVSLCTPDLQAHAAAARAALTDASAAIQAQQRLADAAANAAAQTRAAVTARDQVHALQDRVDAAAGVHAVAQERLAPLQQRVAERLADLKQARLSLPPSPAGGGPAPAPSLALQQRIDRLTTALNDAQADLRRQHVEVNRLQGLLSAEAGPLALRRAEVAHAAGPEASAQAQRVTRGAAAAAADTAASASAAARDALKRHADAAHRHIELAIDALCEEMRHTPKRMA